MSSIKITLLDNVNTTKTVLVEPGTTFEEILEMDQVRELCDPDDPKDVATSIAGTNISDSPRLKRIMLGESAEVGDTIDLDVEFPEDEEELAEDLGVDQSSDATTNSATGTVIVLISGGIISVKLNITPGRSTIQDALTNDAVIARSGMNAAALADATVRVAGAYYESAESRRTTVLQDGQVIEVNPRQSSNKGAN